MGQLIQIAPANQPPQASLFTEPLQLSHTKTTMARTPALALTPEVAAMLKRNCVVAIGVSGGKDSQACAISVARHLDAIGHTGPRVLVHASLGSIEWLESLPSCERLATHLGWELIVTRSKSGGLMERFLSRWAANARRYEELRSVKLILPFSTAKMRFCTSDSKNRPISQALRKRFPREEILNVTGIRHQESTKRSEMPISKIDVGLTRKKAGAGRSWNPIIEWKIEDVFSCIADAGVCLHEAYTKYGTTRVSCVFCILARQSDLLAATTCTDNHAIYVQLAELEATSTFSFQTKWLADVAPHLLSDELRDRIQIAKDVAEKRKRIEKRIPERLLFKKGWPTTIPTLEEAEMIAEIRRTVSEGARLNSRYLTGRQVRDRYIELYEKKHGSLLASCTEEAA